MARPSKWRLSPIDRIRVPTVLAASFEALAAAIDQNAPEAAQSILDAVLQKYCEQPELAPQEGTFTISAPALPVKPVDPHEVLLEDDDPLSDAVLSAAFQPAVPLPESERDRQWLEPALASNSENQPPAVTETAVTETDAISDGPTATAASSETVMTPLESLPSPLATVEPPVALAVTNESVAPAPPTVNLDALADQLQLVAAYSRVVPMHPVAMTPEKPLATELVVTVAAKEAEGVEDATVETTVPVTVPAPEALVTATVETLEAANSEAVKAVVEPSEAATSAVVETVVETTSAVAETVVEASEGVPTETVAALPETPESVAIAAPDLEPVALQTGSTTAVSTATFTGSATVASAATLNRSETVATTSLPTQRGDIEGCRQEPESLTLDPTHLASAPVTLTTTAESVEVPAASTTSFRREFSSLTVEFQPPLELGQNVESETVEPNTESESFRRKLVAPEPNSCHSFVAPQKLRPELTKEAVNTTTVVFALPVASNQHASFQSPLSYCQNSHLTSLELLPKLKSPDKMVANGSTNGTESQVLKTAVDFKQWVLLASGTNALEVSGANETTVPVPLSEMPPVKAVVANANFTAVKVAVTPTTSLPDPPPPVDMVHELANFAATLFSTWQRLTLAKRGELSLCWGLQVSFDYIYREGFKYMTAYRFFVLLETLLQSETDYAYGCLQVVNQGKMEPVALNGTLYNRLTFYAPGSPKHAQNQTATKLARGTVALEPSEGSASELERIRQERQAHLDALTQDEVKAKVQQSRTQKTGSLFGTLTKLGRRLLS